MTKSHAILTAAKWWADKLRQRQPHSNGDNSFGSIAACSLADMLADEITDEQLALFTAALEAEIHKFMGQYDDCHTFLSCDYGPGGMLREAADKAKISEFNFPYKTHMCIKRDGDNYTVLAAGGYGAGYEEVAPCALEEA